MATQTVLLNGINENRENGSLTITKTLQSQVEYNSHEYISVELKIGKISHSLFITNDEWKVLKSMFN